MTAVRLNAALVAGAGLVLLVAPEALAATDALVLGHLVGAALLGFATRLWTARGLILGGIYGRAVVAGNGTSATVGMLGRSLLDAPSAASGALFGVLVCGAALFGVLPRSPPGPRRVGAHRSAHQSRASISR